MRHACCDAGRWNRCSSCTRLPVQWGPRGCPVPVASGLVAVLPRALRHLKAGMWCNHLRTAAGTDDEMPPLPEDLEAAAPAPDADRDEEAAAAHQVGVDGRDGHRSERDRDRDRDGNRSHKHHDEERHGERKRGRESDSHRCGLF